MDNTTAGNFSLVIWMGIISAMGFAVTVAFGWIFSRAQATIDELQKDHSDMKLRIAEHNPTHTHLKEMEDRINLNVNRVELSVKAQIEEFCERLDKKQDRACAT